MGRRVTAVILAGGESRRYGSDKAFALWDGQPFLQRVGKAVSGVSDAFLVLAPHGANGVDYAKLVPGASVLPDRAGGTGPVSALRGALDVIRTPTVLVVPCDAPGLPAGLARRLVAISEELRRPTVATPASGPVWSLFAIPRALLEQRLASAKRLEDLLGDAEKVGTTADGLNVNEPSRAK